MIPVSPVAQSTSGLKQGSRGCCGLSSRPLNFELGARAGVNATAGIEGRIAFRNVTECARWVLFAKIAFL
jgi:hypothetical protein